MYTYTIGVVTLTLTLVLLLLTYMYKDYLRDAWFRSSVIVLALEHPPRLVVSLTTSPKRIEYLEPVIDSIMKQTIVPEKIYLNLPELFKRDNTMFKKPLPEFITSNHLIYINWCEDIGPITKILPTIKLEPNPDTLILSIDDDIYYPPSLIETFLAFSQAYPDACITGTSYMYYDKPDKIKYSRNDYHLEGEPVELVEGYSGVLYHQKHLLNFDTRWLDTKSCAFGDDFYISNELRKKNIPIIKIGRKYAPIMNITPLEYGLKSDALHNGVAGGNSDNYIKCSAVLEKNNNLFIDYHRKVNST